MKASGTRAIIIEDEALVANVIEDALITLGVEIAGRASDGKAGVALCAKVLPDVVFMDIQMPELNGIDAARLIQEQCPTPVIMLTVHTDPQLADLCAEAGVGAFLLKPPRVDELERAIVIARARFKDLMDLRKLNAELRNALSQVKTLEGMLPVCAWCKKIRDDKGYWHSVEKYLSERSALEFSHGICPDCKETVKNQKE